RQLPRKRGLQCVPIAQVASVSQNGKHPGESGIPPMWVYQKPVQMKPSRQPPVAMVRAEGMQARTQEDSARGPSPRVRHVEPRPPHSERSVAGPAISWQVPVHTPPGKLESHINWSPQSMSCVQGEPAEERATSV